MMAGEGSFKSLFSLSKPMDKGVTEPIRRDAGPKDYLNEEIAAAREAVQNLDRAVSGAQSFREKSTKLLEEALRTLGRLEQAVAYRDYAPELIVIACEIKCAARRGITLVNVYGKYNTMVKIMTVFLRSYIHTKFDKQVEHLRSLFPPAAPGAPLAPLGMGGSVPPATVVVGLATSSVVNPQISNASLPTVTQPQGNLARASLSHQGQPPPSSNGTQTHALVGAMLRPTSHDRVQAMAYVPPTQSAMDYVCIWWSAGQRLVFYSEATQSTTNFQIDKAALNVTAVGIDEDGNVWTGHAKGLVRVRPKQKWELMVEEKAFSTAVKAITFDGVGRAWVGDDSGRIKVLGYDLRAGRLDTLASLQRSPALLAKMTGALANTTRGLFGKRHGAKSAGTRQASVDETQPQPATAGPVDQDSSESNLDGASGHNQPVAIEGPVRCIFVRGGRAWTSGGRSSGWLQMWDAVSYEDLDVFDCSRFGPCNAMASLRWPSASPAAASGPVTAGTTYQNNAPGATPRRTRSDAANPAPDGGPGGSWRLLTGHENGQLLLWHPTHRNLAPLLRIGEPGSPCRGIAAFEPFHLVVTGHQDGKLHLFLQPATEGGLPPGSDSASPQSFGTLRPRTVVIQAHKSRVDRMTFCSNSLVTASVLGTIRLWHAADLATEAQRHGLLAHAPSYTSLAAQNGAAQGSVRAGECSGPYAPAQYSRTSNKHLVGGDLSQAPSGVLVSTPPSNQMSTNLSTAMSQGSLGSVQQQQQGMGMGLAAASTGGPGTHHARQASRDSTEVGYSTPSLTPSAQATQSNSGHSAQGDTAAGSLAQPLPGAVAGLPHFQTIEISELSVMKHIGSGAYGCVFLAEWAGCQVAVKELLGLQSGVCNSDDKEYVALMNEMYLLGSLSHPNIVRFLAVCLDPPRIVMQYYPQGSLFDLLHRTQRSCAKAAKELSWGKRLDMLRDVAAGMQYLHSRKPPVIHGDLRSPNLLLDLTIDHDRPRFHVKIADFGLARIATGATGSVMVSKTTNPRWLAPEVIRNSSVGKQADVYSFAIIMWEMLTWQQPYEGMMTVQVMYSIVNVNMRPEVPAESQLPGNPGVSLPKYRELMESCWHMDASKRPTFKQVLEVLQDMQRLEMENARQQRQQAHGGTPASIARRSRRVSEIDGPVAGTAAIDAPDEGVAAIGGGNAGLIGGAGAAMTAVAPRRVPGPGNASPFANTPFASAATMEGEPGKGMSPYGMSPILEEQMSSCGPHSRTSLHPATSPLGMQAIKKERPNGPSISAEDVNAGADDGAGDTELGTFGAAGGARRASDSLPAGPTRQGTGVDHPDCPGNTAGSMPTTAPGGINNGKAPVVESISVPGGGGMTGLSAFACLAAAQLGALDAAAPHNAGPSPASIMPPGGATKYQMIGLIPGPAARAGVATPSRVAQHRPGGSGGSVAAAGPAASARARNHGPARAGVSTGLGAMRGNGTTSQLQPDTPPHWNTAVLSPAARGLGGGGVVEVRTSGGRIGGASARLQCSAGGDDGNPAPFSPVERCSPAGAPMTDRTPYAAHAVVEQQLDARRRSASAVHSHVEVYTAPSDVPANGGVAAGRSSHRRTPSGDVHMTMFDAAATGGTTLGRRTHRRTPSGDTFMTSLHGATNGSTLSGRPSHRRTPSGGNVSGASFASPTMSSRNRDAAVAMTVHRELTSPFTPPTAAAGSCSQVRATSTASRSGRASPHLAASTASSSDSRAGPRRNTAGASPGTTSGVVSPTANSSCQASRLGMGGTNRLPVSSCTLLPGGPGSTFVGASRRNSIIATVSLGSRVSSVVPGSAQAPAVPSRSSTCRSLDDLNMHRHGVSHLALCSTPAASLSNASGAPADAATNANQLDMMQGWEDGLRVQHSPDATTELNSRTSLMAISRARDTHSSTGDPETGHSLPAGESNNNAVTRQSPDSSGSVVVAGGATWEPPPLLAATSGCRGSPFAAAAYSPFDGPMDDRPTEEPAAVCEDADV